MNFDVYGNLFIAVLILLVSAVIVPILSKQRKLAGWLNFILVAIASGILLNISYSALTTNTPVANRLITAGPLSVYFLIDAFSGFFIGLISFMAVMSAFYSIQYMEHYPEYKLGSFYVNFPIFIIGMIGIVTVDDLSTGFSIAWQLMTIASYFLIRFEYKETGVIKSANKYLALMELAWVIILASTFFIDGIAIGDSIHTITGKISAVKGASLFIVYGLLLIGFGFKAGMFPLGQLWLPDAHSIAPSPISALLSGVMIKTGIYGIIRTFFWMIPQNSEFTVQVNIWGIVIATIGVLTLFFGTVQALKQSDAKRLHAYHSIGQIGYIILGIGCALVMFNNPDENIKLLAIVAIIGALYHTLNHTVFKGLLFLSTGSIVYATGTRDLNKLGGLMKLMPISALVAGIASLSIAGMPCFSGFASKWSIISSSLLSGSAIPFLVLFGIIALFTSAVTLASYVKFFGMAFASEGAAWNTNKQIKEVPFMMLLPKIVLAILCLVQGLLPFFYFQAIFTVLQKSGGSMIQPLFAKVATSGLGLFSQNMMGVSVSVFGIKGLSVSAITPVVLFIIIAIAMIFAWLIKKSGGSVEKQAAPWLCGYQDINNKNRYTSRNMYHAFKHMLWWTGGNEKK